APTIAVVNNVSLDHKSMEELRQLFGDFTAKAATAVLNLDNEETAALARALPAGKAVTYSLSNPDADLLALDPTPEPGGIGFDVRLKGGERTHVDLGAPGLHNVSNALAAVGAALACGVSLAECAAALSTFTGIRRR